MIETPKSYITTKLRDVCIINIFEKFLQKLLKSQKQLHNLGHLGKVKCSLCTITSFHRLL